MSSNLTISIDDYDKTDRDTLEIMECAKYIHVTLSKLGNLFVVTVHMFIT